MMHYNNCVKLLSILICICLPLKICGRPAKELEEIPEMPNENTPTDLSSPHPPMVAQTTPQKNFDPDSIDEFDKPSMPSSLPVEIGEGDENGNTPSQSSHNEIDEGDQGDPLDIKIDENVEPQEDRLEASPTDDRKGDIGDEGLADENATKLDKPEPPALPSSVQTPQPQNNLPHAADKPVSPNLEDKHTLSPTGVKTPPQQSTTPRKTADGRSNPLVPVVNPAESNGNPLTTTSVSAMLTQSVDSKDSSISSEAPAAPIPVSISSTQPVSQSETPVQSNQGQNENVEPKELSSPGETGDDRTSSNQTIDETEEMKNDESEGIKYDESDSPTISQSPQMKITTTTTKSIDRKSSTQVASEITVTPDDAISIQLTETMHPNIEGNTENSLVELDGPLTTQKLQSTLSLSDIPQDKLSKPMDSINNSIEITTSSSLLQLAPTGSLIGTHLLANESIIPMIPKEVDSVDEIPSSKSPATTSTSAKSPPSTADASMLSPVLSLSTTTAFLSPTPSTTSSTTSITSTTTVMPEAAATRADLPVTSSTKLSTTTTTTTTAKPSVSSEAKSPPVKSDSSVTEETEHNRKRPSVKAGPGREGGSSVDENPSEVNSPTSSSVSVGEVSTSGNSTNDQDFFTKVKGMVGDVEPFYIALTLLILLTLTLITCCCCCKLCSRKRRGIRHRRLKEYGKEKEFLLRDRGKGNNYHNDSVTLLQGSSEDEF